MSALASSSSGGRAVVGRERHADARLHVERRPARGRSCGAARPAGARRPLHGARGPGTLGSSTANSSPPRRASVSPCTERPRQPQRHLAQQLVAVGVPERVVDLLEAVEVDEQHRCLIVAARGGRERALDPVLEQHTIGQAGQRVVRRLAAQPARSERDDAVQRGPEQQQADGEHPVHRARIRRRSRPRSRCGRGRPRRRRRVRASAVSRSGT